MARSKVKSKPHHNIAHSTGTISGLFDASIDGGITFNASSVATWNHTPIFTQLDACIQMFRPSCPLYFILNIAANPCKQTAILLPLVCMLT